MWHNVWRKRPADDQFLRHSEWVRRLGVPLLVSLAGVKSIALMVFVVLPYSLTTVAGPSTVFALILTFLIVFLAASHLAELSCAMPKNCVHYHFSFSALGELPAFLIGWASLLDYLAHAALLARAWAEHLNLMFRGAPAKALTISFASEDSMELAPNIDLLVLIAAFITLTILLCSLRVVGTICVSMLAVTLLIMASCSLVAFFHADPANWIKADFFTFGYQGVLHAICALTACYTGVESTTCLLEETKNPRKRVSSVFSFLVVTLTIIFFVVSLVFSLCTNVSELNDGILIPEIFTVLNIPAARYMLTVCSVCALSGGVLASFLPATRTIAALCNDHLIPYARDSSTKTPYFAVLLCTLLVALSSLLRKSLLLNFVVFSAPIKLVITVMLTYIQHFLPEPIGIPHETSNYKSIGKRMRISLNDGVSTEEDDDSAQQRTATSHDDCGISHSTFDTTAFLYMSAVRVESDRLQKRLEKEQQKEFSEELPLPKSVSQYHTMGFTRPVALQEHNCVAHQCASSDNGSDGPHSTHVHLFGNTECEVPFFSSGSTTPRASTPILGTCHYHRAMMILLVFSVATCCLSLVIRHTGFETMMSMVMFLFFSSFVIGTTVMAHQIPTNDLHKRTAKVPLFPALSLLPMFVLLLAISSSIPSSTVTHFGICLAAGVFLYFAYGYQHSAHRNQPCTIIENQFSDQLDQYRPIVGDDRTSSM